MLCDDILAQIFTYLDSISMMSVFFTSKKYRRIITSCKDFKFIKKWSFCRMAAFAGHLNLLIWARENEYSWDEYTCFYAAVEGHLEVLKWARNNGCPWNEDTCAGTAEYGHLEVLQWARNNGCFWSPITFRSAKRGLHSEVIQWVINNGCPIQ